MLDKLLIEGQKAVSEAGRKHYKAVQHARSLYKKKGAEQLDAFRKAKKLLFEYLNIKGQVEIEYKKAVEDFEKSNKIG